MQGRKGIRILKIKKQIRRSALQFIILFTCLTLIVIWGKPGSGQCTFGYSTAWVGVEWVSKPASEPSVKALAQLHLNNHVRDIYVYTSYLRSDGTFNNTDDYLSTFTEQYRRFNRDSRLLAWIGIPLTHQHSLGIDGWVDLSQAQTREQIVDYIKEVVQKGDLDGIHLNAETVWDGDPHFIQLLQEIQAVLEPDKTLSIAGAHWMPAIPSLFPVVGKFRWSSNYYRRVGKFTDQIAVMTYDSYLPMDSLYRLWVREQSKGIRKSLSAKNVEIVFGFSASKEATRSHKPNVETLTNGLLGICDSFNHTASLNDLNSTGIGVYASWDANDEEWNALRSFIVDVR